MLALTRHFFHDFFRLSFLDDAGEESFRRVIIGVLAGFVALGLWLPRVLSLKYVGGFSTREAYLAVAQGDQLLLIVLSMFIAAFAIALIAHSLFPDELDYRILMALPVTRATVFGAKVLALCAFAALFVLTTNVALSLPYAAVTRSKWTFHYWPIRGIVLTAAGVLASTFAAAATVAIQGLVVVLTPKNWLRTVSIATQTALVCGLVLLLPFVLRMPAHAADLYVPSATAWLLPPIWFLGLEELLLGNATGSSLNFAFAAGAGMVAVTLLTVACYAIVYARFDQVIVRTHSVQHTRKTRTPPFSRGRIPEYGAVTAFTAATLGRSGLHQLVFIGIAAAAFAFATNSLLGSVYGTARITAVQRAPFVLMFGAVLGLHAALLLPVTRRAAWIFRLTEADRSRVHQIAAAEHIAILYGVVAPIAVVLPAQIWLLGPRNALMCVPVMLSLGVALVELRLMRWHRIPFTCSYLPGKRPVAHSFLLLLVGFAAFTSIGYGLLVRTIRTGIPPVIALAVVLSVAAAARWVRLQTGNKPLEFEDELPDASYGLHLNT